jgi:hypothetical protein
MNKRNNIFTSHIHFFVHLISKSTFGFMGPTLGLINLMVDLKFGCMQMYKRCITIKKTGFLNGVFIEGFRNCLEKKNYERFS